MVKKPRFDKPIITRIKLDPEQAVLAECLVNGAYYGAVALSAYPCFASSGSRNKCAIPKRGLATYFGGSSINSAMGS